MTMSVRLSDSTVRRLPDDIVRPGYDRSAISSGIVHLGVGAFHRAHQAVYTDDAIAAEGGDWGITGVSLRRPDMRDRLQPQDGLFVVEAREDQRRDRRLIGAMKSLLVAPENPDAVIAALADPGTQIITLTVTEKGYALNPDTGDLNVEADDIAADLRTPERPKTTLGYLFAGMRARRLAGVAAPTLISCDNLPDNGQRLRAGLVAYAQIVDPATAHWLEAHAAFPSTMVDRIVPAVTAELIADFTAETGLEDQGFLATEPFSQWVIEDWFSGPRPAWEAGCAQITKDVSAFETAKLRLLNGPHSTIAYLGYLAGHRFVHEAMADPPFASFVEALMTEEILPTVAQPAGLDLHEYTKQLRARFANSALNHSTWQIAMDGSQKLPQRLLNTVRDQLRREAPIERLALAVAAWMRYVTGRDEAGEPIDVRDPMAGRLADTAARVRGEPHALAQAYLGISEIFGADLPQNVRFTAAVEDALESLLEHGAAKTIKAFQLANSITPD
ncbi:MAG: mannitol dehydrogenase family protein [Henriciella sp.]|nr:mannitol dehydrogenase family protein [Henriciella sp.]